MVTDGDEQLGQPIVSNGLPLTKIHHTVFNAHLIGIDPDFPNHVSDRLLESHHGLFLEFGLKEIAGTLIDRPNRIENRPERDCWRFGSSNLRSPHSFDRTKRHAEERHWLL